uniref:Venom serine carboxypeptidase n=1 Tax=Lygus hesperus TaxID=30085 RepID=A0A146L0Q8_LYGHE
MIGVLIHALLLAGWIAYTNIVVSHMDSRCECGKVLDRGPGQPLILTPYLKGNRREEGKKAARVPDILPGVESYSGFFTVNEKYDSNMFFWFFPTETGQKDAPVILWLQGGQGVSSLVGTFMENGPFRLLDGPTAIRNTYYWSENLNVLYIDNPVGAGFSFTKNDSGFPDSLEEVGEDLYSAVVQFFDLFPEYEKNEFFIAGESYGAKYVTALARRIHKDTAKPTKMNLVGISIGNGWIDPLRMVDYSNYLWNLGFIDLETYRIFSRIEENIRSLILSCKYVEASKALDEYIRGNVSIFTNVAELNQYFNYVNPTVTGNDKLLREFLKQPEIRDVIHVGHVEFGKQSAHVRKHLEADVMKSVLLWLEQLMNHYRVLLYNGQLDVFCAYPTTMNYVEKMEWSGIEVYRAAERKLWHVVNDLAGYAKTARNFTEVLVRDAGHMVPADKPLWAQDMILHFTKNIPFDKQL